jgi:hypothetical protein
MKEQLFKSHFYYPLKKVALLHLSKRVFFYLVHHVGDCGNTQQLPKYIENTHFWNYYEVNQGPFGNNCKIQEDIYHVIKNLRST